MGREGALVELDVSEARGGGQRGMMIPEGGARSNGPMLSVTYRTLCMRDVLQVSCKPGVPLVAQYMYVSYILVLLSLCCTLQLSSASVLSAGQRLEGIVLPCNFKQQSSSSVP